LERLRIELAQAKNKRDQAKDTADTFKKLYASIGHGGISRVKLMEKQGEYLKAESEYQSKRSQLENLEVKFSGQRTEAGGKIEASYFQLLELRLKHETKMQEIENAEIQVTSRYRNALAAWEAAARVNLEDLDADNFLKINAPASGDVTYVAYRQSGEKVRATAPIITIAPGDTGKILRIGIQDKDRGLLRVGQPVKLKFVAFPYQRYGFISGKLEYISPSARAPQQGQSGQGQGRGQQQQRPFYLGRVSLEKDYFSVNGENIKIRYGMMAVAEVVVQKRRMIDLALDPFRRLKG
jgi:HlyD family secretion protein